MRFYTTLSLDIMLAILGIAGVFWGLRKELDKKFSEMRTELKNYIAGLRQELKDDIAGLRKDLKDVDNKVDASNQRLARLEGVILSREGLVDDIVGTNAPE